MYALPVLSILECGERVEYDILLTVCKDPTPWQWIFSLGGNVPPSQLQASVTMAGLGWSYTVTSETD
jgi:hypothetical protein